jgi:hypothetical protein
MIGTPAFLHSTKLHAGYSPLSTGNPKRFMKLLIHEVRESMIDKDCYNQIIPET